jgi:hypothetical protein
MAFEEKYKKKEDGSDRHLLFIVPCLIEKLHEEKKQETRDLSVFSPVRWRAYGILTVCDDTQGPGTKEDGYLAYYEICNFVLGRLEFILIL